MAHFVPHTDEELAAMLDFIGLSSLDELFECVPAALRLAGGLDLPAGLSEPDVMAEMERLAGRNGACGPDLICFAGAGAYDRKLAALDAWIRSEIAGVPAEQRRAITDHDAFAYFAKAYGVEFLALRGRVPESEPPAKRIAELIAELRAHKVRALFFENMSNPALIQQIARDAGAIVGPELYSDALSAPGGPAATYEAMMRHNVTALVAGMKRN